MMILDKAEQGIQIQISLDTIHVNLYAILFLFSFPRHDYKPSCQQHIQSHTLMTSIIITLDDGDDDGIISDGGGGVVDAIFFS